MKKKKILKLMMGNYETEKQIKKVQEEKKRRAKSNNPNKMDSRYFGSNSGVEESYPIEYYKEYGNRNYPSTSYYYGQKNIDNNSPNYDDTQQKNEKSKRKHYMTNVNIINNYQTGLCGIQNIGNNCYLNSGLQILSRCSRFVEKLRVLYDPKYPFTALLYEAFSNLLTKKERYNPSEFVNKFCSINKEFIVGEQSCSQNFIRTVLNNVNNEIIPYNIYVIKSYNNYKPKDQREINSYINYIKQNQILPESEALSVFSGILKSHLKGKCEKCHNIVDNYSFCYFIDQNMYLDSFSKHCYFYQVIEDNLMDKNLIMDCQKCFGKESVKLVEKTKIVKLPEILIFTLERYLNGTNETRVLADDEIDLKPYIDENLIIDSAKYELFAKNIRLGTTKKFGHEICQIKIAQNWIEFNDSQISIKNIDHDNYTYGLFYKKIK